MLKLIRRLFEELNNSNIRYCHWKSNVFLERFLRGEGDLDILVDKKDKVKCEKVLSSLSFKKVGSAGPIIYSSVHHFYGFDEQTGIIVHIHLYYEIIIGGDLLKNYHLAIEEMFFKNIRYEGIVKLPTKPAELLVFVIRMILKHGLIVESLLINREYEYLKKELRWLTEGNAEIAALQLLESWLPSIDSKLFITGIQALKSRLNIFGCGMLSWRIQECIKKYARYSFLQAFIITHFIFLRKLYQRFIVRERGKVLPYGGSIIAFVGPEASGKSTLAREIRKWLGEHFSVFLVHIGKPPATWITFLPNKIIPALRKLLPNYRTSNIDTVTEVESNKRLSGIFLFIYIIRALMIAWDRLHLLRKVSRLARCGRIVICDRYPTTHLGAMDSSRLDGSILSNTSSLLYKLGSLENRIYARMPRPDLVINLIVPLNIALQRNVSRRKKETEDEDYIRRRHAQSIKQIYPHSKTHWISTNESFHQTQLEVKKIIWENLNFYGDNPTT